MFENEKIEFAKIMLGTAEYYGRAITQPVIEIYWQGLKSFSLEEIMRAINLHIADPDAGQYMPKISDVTKILHGSKQNRAMTAWTKVDKAIRKVGPWESVCFDDPIIHRVLQDMGGWIYLCSTATDKDLEFKMHEFNKRYQGYVLQGQIPEHPRYFVGLTEANNAAEGYHYDEPKLIGDQSKAAAVLTHERKESVLKLVENKQHETKKEN